MNCKPGDVAIIIAATTEHGAPYVGKIVRCVKIMNSQFDSWETEPELYSHIDGGGIWWKDCHLRPVSGLPLEEETEQKLKEPA